MSSLFRDTIYVDCPHCGHEGSKKVELEFLGGKAYKVGCLVCRTILGVAIYDCRTGGFIIEDI